MDNTFCAHTTFFQKEIKHLFKKNPNVKRKNVYNPSEDQRVQILLPTYAYWNLHHCDR